MFSQQNSRPALSTAAMLLHKIELQKQNGFPESNLVSNVHLLLTNSFINLKELQDCKRVFCQILIKCCVLAKESASLISGPPFFHEINTKVYYFV